MLFTACLFSCKSGEQSIVLHKISGPTMGTSYNISYRSSESINYKPQVDSILVAINDEVSTYEPNSIITRFNKTAEPMCLEHPSKTNRCNGCHFYTVYKSAEQIYYKTDKHFDPTIMPLVNYWGFGYKKKQAVINQNKDTIQEILNFVGMDKLELIVEKNTACKSILNKSNPKSELDFSAIAKGYAVDYLAEFLEEKHISDYLVEIGGEVRASGTNPKSEPWKIGINVPSEDAKVTDFQTIVALNNKSLASSGNYRIFYEVDGKKYGHEINPISGYPEKNKLLGVSVITDNCMEADAYATAFMIMGLEKSIKLVEAYESMEAYFIFGNDAGGMDVKYTDGFAQYIMTPKQ